MTELFIIPYKFKSEYEIHACAFSDLRNIFRLYFTILLVPVGGSFIAELNDDFPARATTFDVLKMKYAPAVNEILKIIPGSVDIGATLFNSAEIELSWYKEKCDSGSAKYRKIYNEELKFLEKIKKRKILELNDDIRIVLDCSKFDIMYSRNNLFYSNCGCMPGGY